MSREFLFGDEPFPTGPTHFRVEDHPSFDRFDVVLKWAARRAEFVLGKAARIGNFDLMTKRHMVDFGAGYGGPTVALAQLARQNDGVVDAVEENASRVERIRQMRILPDDHVHLGSGIDYLKGLSGESVGLITAFMLGPDDDGRLARDLIAVAREGSDGHLLITSDLTTIGATQLACQEMGVDYRYFVAATEDSRPTIGAVLVPLEDTSA